PRKRRTLYQGITNPAAQAALATPATNLGITPAIPVILTTATDSRSPRVAQLRWLHAEFRTRRTARPSFGAVCAGPANVRHALSEACGGQQRHRFHQGSYEVAGVVREQKPQLPAY
ncbi:hypothetical protein ACIO02_37040, partial [Streptomyces sp. NPDC087568]|uniref:hypothetical protein n=1 Tax=Streptomyces sp. NPDC087568 TaxID=3365799 RepID=UPI003814619F